MNDTLAAHTSSFIPFNGGGLERSIVDRFEQIANKYPDRVAVATDAHSMTYADLNALSNRIAHVILPDTAPGSEAVMVMMEKSAITIAALLGILKAGKIYTPVDPSFPRARIDYMLQDSKAKLIVCNNANLSLAKECAGDKIQLINVDTIDDTVASNSPDVSINPDNIAWILYTSGSTGRPKGVVQNHRNVLHYVKVYTNEMQVCADDRLSLLYSCAVNGGAHEIFTALLNGASLYPYSIEVDGVVGIGKWLTKHKLTFYSSVPTVFRHFVGTLKGDEDLSSLRFVKLIGEPVYKRDVELFINNLPDSCTFINRLGSSETGTIRWHFINHETLIEDNNVPVGCAVEDNDVFLVDESNNRIASGEIGEIVVKSRYLSPGYWGKPEVTNKAFMPDPGGAKERLFFTGDMGRMLAGDCLMCLGRKDSQIKIHGYRIEAGEVERALLETDAVKDTIVIAIKLEELDQQLVAYVVPVDSSKLSIPDLRQSLNIMLPTYMIPSYFVVLDQLPYAPNGKVDRKALPHPGEVQLPRENPFVAPRTKIESVLAEIWSSVLGVKKVGVTDNFKELGGNSFKAMQIVSQVIDRLGTSVPMHHLLKEGNIEKMAELISTTTTK